MNGFLGNVQFNQVRNTNTFFLDFVFFSVTLIYLTRSKCYSNVLRYALTELTQQRIK